MKWIGQHIWDFISRFRNTVYLENLETSSNENVLVVDSDGKVTKNTTLGGDDLSFDGSTANGVLTYKDADEISVESTLTYDSETLTIGENDSGATTIARKWNTSGGNGGNFSLIGGIGSGANANGGDLLFYSGAPTGSGTFGDFQFWSGDVDTSGTPSTSTLRTWSKIAHLVSNAATSTDFYLYEKSGASDDDYFKISCAEHGATTLTTVDDNATVAHFNVVADGDIVLDSASGIIKTGSTTFVNNSGVIQVATQGTIDHDSLANFVAAEHYDWSSDISGTATVHTNNITDLHGAGVDGANNQLLTDKGDGAINSEAYMIFQNTSNTSDFRILSDQNVNDMLRVRVTTNGATTIQTEDGDAALANLQITADGTAELAGTTVTLDSAANIELEVGNATNYVQTAGVFRGSNIGTIQDLKIPVSPTQFIGNSYRFHPQYNIASGGITMPSASYNAYAEIIIPNGYTATSCSMYATDADNDGTITCYEGSTVANTSSAVALADTFSSGSVTHDFGSNDIVGNGAKTVIIEWNPGDIADVLHGGFITIEKTT